jgi:DNA invertase Pin-like site-specific DNA recombinase
VTRRLPRSLDDLRGLRAARWIRESTAGQQDRYGPDSQRDRQTEFIERFGLVDTGLEYVVSHSGRTVWRSPAMREMLEAAGDAFDVILVGYFDRWQRNTRRTLELVEDRLHPAGCSWAMCDRRLLSSDPRDWREMRRLSSEAEEYSEKLGERITDGYAAKFRRLADQAGRRRSASGARSRRRTSSRSIH